MKSTEQQTICPQRMGTMMSSDANENEVAAGRGRLAEVIASRGGLAAPEAPFVIEHREALIYMLCDRPRV